MNAMEIILAPARCPRERDRPGMESPGRAVRRSVADIALVLVLRDCGRRRSEAALLVAAASEEAGVSEDCEGRGAGPATRPTRRWKCFRVGGRPRFMPWFRPDMSMPTSSADQGQTVLERRRSSMSRRPSGRCPVP